MVICSENGTWSDNTDTNSSLTNYTSCADKKDVQFRSYLNHIYVAGYTASTILLTLSLIIFACFRSLRNTRALIHMHMYCSFAMNNVFWILWYTTVVNSSSVIRQNKAWCQILHVVAHYFLVTGYAWMFCESIYLHLSLAVVFVNDYLAKRFLVTASWGFSLLIIIVYAAVRYFVTGATKRCWIDDNESLLIITVPIVISLVTSLLIVLNIIRVLIIKLRRNPNHSGYVATQKVARAFVLLIPLFGLHFILVPVRPQHNAPGEHFYEIVAALLVSLQGACISILICIINPNVFTVVKTRYRRYRNANENIPMTAVSGGDSLLNARENIT